MRELADEPSVAEAEAPDALWLAELSVSVGVAVEVGVASASLDPDTEAVAVAVPVWLMVADLDAEEPYLRNKHG